MRTYYPRLYDAKFIKGAIAGTLVQDGRIGYVADYPTYGSIAGINAFAQGRGWSTPTPGSIWSGPT